MDPQAADDTTTRAAVERSWAPAALWIAAYVLFRWTLQTLRLPLHTPVALIALAGVAGAFGAIGLPIGIISALARTRLRALHAVLLAAGGLALWIGLLFALRATPRTLLSVSFTLQDLGKILAAAGAGIALASAIEEVNILLPAGMFAAFADFIVVTRGTVKHALAPSNTKGQALVQAVSAHTPAVHPALPEFTVGPADFLFLGIFLACAWRFGMDLKRNALVLTAVLAVSLLLVPEIGPVPALAPMSVAFVALNWRRFRLTREELVSTAVVLALIGTLFFGYFQVVYRQR